MNYEDKNQKFQEMLIEISKIAERDGTITSSEAEVLSTAKISIKKFQLGVNKALEDGIITDGESLMLHNIEQNFLREVFDLIEKDEKLDNDGKLLVEKLFDVLMATLD